MPDTSELAIALQSNFAGFVSNEDSISASMRADWGIPLLEEDSVVIVTDPATCNEAAEAYAREEALSDSSFRVVVLRIRQLRVVVPEPEPGPEPTGPPFQFVIAPLFGVIFDSTFVTVIDRLML